jgi:hypothetical protein
MKIPILVNRVRAGRVRQILCMVICSISGSPFADPWGQSRLELFYKIRAANAKHFAQIETQ